MALARKKAQLNVKQAEINTIDQTFMLLGLECDPELTRPRKSYTRTFKRGELKRLIIKILKEVNGGPLTTRQITNEVMRRKGLDSDYWDHVKRALRRYPITVKLRENENGESMWALKTYTTKPKNDPPLLRLA